MSTEESRKLCDQLGRTRRQFLHSVGGGVLGAALSSLCADEAQAVEEVTHGGSPPPPSDLKPRTHHHKPRARAMIHLFMNGGPSQMDLFDPKPELDRNHGKSYFERIAGELESPTQAGSLMRSPYNFARHGECGMWVSELMPHLARRVDDIAFIRSMFTTNLTHEPALYIIHSGQMLPGLPSLGSWVTYGLGSVNQNLPAYVVLDDPKGLPVNRTQSWQAGYLPPVFQGTRFRSKGSAVLNLKPGYAQPEDITKLEREFVTQLDRVHQGERLGYPQLDAKIATYELAARMQLAATDALDVASESQATLDLYGIGNEPTDSYGRRCLIARRLIERGVRFVQLFIDFQIWDNHTRLEPSLRRACERTDQPIAALLTDLKRRGLLDSTLVAWGGEFGRLPVAQLPANKDARNAGRDHNKNAFCTWFAGGGVRGGTIHGETDELGFAATVNPVGVPDWHATILHLLGLNHEHLFLERNGLKNKLTATFDAHVVEDILA